jgi:hypothetical protein
MWREGVHPCYATFSPTKKSFILHSIVMPTASAPAAVMAVGDTIWDYETWRERTNYIVVPFQKDATAWQTGLMDQKLAAVKNLADRIHQNTGYHDRLKAFYVKDKDQDGKEAWVEWFRPEHVSWKLRKEMELLLDAYERHPRQLAGDGGRLVSKLHPALATCDVRERLTVSIGPAGS